MASSHKPQPSPSKNPKADLLSLPPPPPSPPPPPLYQPMKIGPSTNIDYNGKKPKPAATATSVLVPSDQDMFLSNSTHLTRQEVLKRRLHNLRQLSKCYRDHYWALMEDLKARYREYVWKFGLSPFREDEEREGAKENENGVIEGSGETNLNANPNPNPNANSNANNLLCAFHGCKLKAMALTRFCHLHILSDAKQQLYKPCDYVIKSAQAGPITCGKPILGSTIPSLCNVHFQKAQKHVTRALKKAGLNVSSSGKVAPKFHVIVAEYVREIQGKRRAALKSSRNKVVARNESAS